MSVAACALKVCMSPAATREGGGGEKNQNKKNHQEKQFFNNIAHSLNEIAYL